MEKKRRRRKQRKKKKLKGGESKISGSDTGQILCLLIIGKRGKTNKVLGLGSSHGLVKEPAVIKGEGVITSRQKDRVVRLTTPRSGSF